MNLMVRAFVTAGIACALSSLGLAAPILQFAGGSSGVGITDGGTVGWEFTTNSAVTVTDLGVWDNNLDGLSVAHQVGIFDSGGGLLVSGTVAAGTAAPLINQFRYVSVAPTVLKAGQTFRIGALYGSADVGTALVTGFLVDSAINFVGARGIVAGSLADPTFATGFDPGIFGPNFITAAPAAPELGSRNSMALYWTVGFLLLQSKARKKVARSVAG